LEQLPEDPVRGIIDLSSAPSWCVSPDFSVILFHPLFCA
jgi:hypothetical protein